MPHCLRAEAAADLGAPLPSTYRYETAFLPGFIKEALVLLGHRDVSIISRESKRGRMRRDDSRLRDLLDTKRVLFENELSREVRNAPIYQIGAMFRISSNFDNGQIALKNELHLMLQRVHRFLILFLTLNEEEWLGTND